MLKEQCVQTNLDICSLNIQGLKRYIDDVNFEKYCHNFDIIGLHETWQENEKEFDDFLQGYINFSCIRRKNVLLVGSPVG